MEMAVRVYPGLLLSPAGKRRSRGVQGESRRYRVLEAVGRGGFGTVYKAALLGPGEFLALLDDPVGASLEDRRGPRSLVQRSPERGARGRR